MHVLVVTINLPCPNGGADTRNHYLLKALASKHRVSLLSYADPDAAQRDPGRQQLEQLTSSLKIVPFQLMPSRAKRQKQLLSTLRGQSHILQSFFSNAMQQALDDYLQDNSIDIVFFESALMAGYRLPASMRRVIDQHNIEHEILERTYQSERSPLRRWYNRREARLLKPVELERCRQANAVVVTSEREQQILQSYLPDQLIVTVPNGVDIYAFQRSSTQGIQEVPGRIIFTGTMNYYPNIEAALQFAQQCWPRIREQVPGATWQIVGREPPAEIRALAELPGVEVTGGVPDVSPYLAQAEVTLAPLHIGSGTRLKILEALAMERAMVSTSVGCEGIDAIPGEHLLIADEPEAFAASVIDLLNNPERRHKIGAAGRTLVEQRYSWQHCGERLLHLMDRVKEKERVC